MHTLFMTWCHISLWPLRQSLIWLVVWHAYINSCQTAGCSQSLHQTINLRVVCLEPVKRVLSFSRLFLILLLSVSYKEWNKIISHHIQKGNCCCPSVSLRVCVEGRGMLGDSDRVTTFSLDDWPNHRCVVPPWSLSQQFPTQRTVLILFHLLLHWLQQSRASQVFLWHTDTYLGFEIFDNEDQGECDLERDWYNPWTKCNNMAATKGFHHLNIHER